MPVNRWAYLDELKQLMQLGVIDDIALLSETDIRNKEKIVQRKSLYSQLQQRLGSLEEAVKDKDGTIETLERQLVQAGIKNKVMQASVEVNKKKDEVKTGMDREQQEKSLQFKAALEGMKLAEEKDKLERDKKDLQETKEVS